MTLIGYDPERVRMLHRLAGRTVDALDAVRSDDPIAWAALSAVRVVRRDLDERCLALARRVLLTDAMLTFGTVGLPAAVGRLVLDLGRGAGGELSTTDEVLIRLLHHFAALDVDGDGELTGEELARGRAHPDAEVRAACDHLLTRPLILVNVAQAGERWWKRSGSQDVDVDEISITATSISHALAQNQVLRLLAQPAMFAALDRARDGEIDGLVSVDDIEVLLLHEADPTVRGLCRWCSAPISWGASIATIVTGRVTGPSPTTRCTASGSTRARSRASPTRRSRPRCATSSVLQSTPAIARRSSSTTPSQRSPEWAT